MPIKFAKPVEISAANGGEIYAYGSGTLRVATSANSLGQEANIQDLYYAPEAHARLVSLGKLEDQGGMTIYVMGRWSHGTRMGSCLPIWRTMSIR